MTLSDEITMDCSVEKRKLKTAGYALMTCLKKTVRNGRLFCGMSSCAQLLSCEPATIMLCVLPDHHNEISVQINHTLIKAFCHERGIPIIELTNQHSIEHLIRKITTKDRHSDLKGDVDDLSCFLIKHSPKGPTKEEINLIQLYKDMTTKGMPVPAIDLPS